MEYFGIRYKTGCRNCMQAGIGDNFIPFANDEQVAKYSSLSGKDLMDQIIRWRNQENKRCLGCNSSNEDILDLSINGKPIYDFNDYQNRLYAENDFFFYQINLDKRNGQISISDGGEMSQDDCIYSGVLVNNEVASSDPDIFVKHPNGNFFCVITLKNNDFDIQVLRHHEFSQHEIVDALSHMLNQLRGM